MPSQLALQKQSMLLRPTRSTSVLKFADQASRGGKSSGRTAHPQCKDAMSTVCNSRSRTALSKIRCCPQILFLVFLVLLALRVLWYRCSFNYDATGTKDLSQLDFLVYYMESTTVFQVNSMHYSAAHWSTWTVASDTSPPAGNIVTCNV